MSTQDTAGVFSGTDAESELVYMISGALIAQAIYVAAELGIADSLVDGAKSADDLAIETNAHPRALYRVMRALASLGIFEETPTNTFALKE